MGIKILLSKLLTFSLGVEKRNWLDVLFISSSLKCTTLGKSL